MKETERRFRFREVAVGGTFDRLHRGHRELLKRAFLGGERVLIGISSDALVLSMGKEGIRPLEERERDLLTFLGRDFPGREFEIQRLEDFYGPRLFRPEVEAIVVSRETLTRVPQANSMRIKMGLPPMKAIVMDDVLAEDGRPISDTRLRRGEIDEEGRLKTRRERT